MMSQSFSLFPLDILYNDQRIVIINKQAGIPVHSNVAGTISIESCFPALSKRRDGPWLAHRLDTDTSGCLAIALRKQPLIAMQEAFANKTALKTYWAVVQGHPEGESGTISLPLLKQNDRHKGWRIITDPKGSPATTSWRVLGRSDTLTWLELTLHTGRTHQARVHCAAMGWPIAGDNLYGTEHKHGLHLLAQSLILPFTPRIAVTAPPRAAMQPALVQCGWKEET